MVRFLPLVGDLERLPFKDRSFDVCFCGYTLHHFSNIDSAVAEFARALKPDGKMVLLEPNGSHIAVRLSEKLENLARRWLFKLGIDSPNETLHRHTVYTSALERLNFVDIRVGSSCTAGLPPLPTKYLNRAVSYRAGMSLVRTLARLRLLFYIVISEILPRPLNGVDLVITATKRAWE
jgi:SAM-dependent methyltransferase